MHANAWYRSPAVLLLASAAAPPVGILLLWVRRGTGVFKKILGTLVIGAWAVAALVLFCGLRAELDGSGMRPIFKFSRPESHYAQIERTRSLQKTTPAPAPEPARVEQAAAEVPARPPATNSAPKDTYWTDFRGPHRDGRYDEMPILTAWPAGGLKPLWKQPVGGGYASLVVAEGRAFTIEQRRRQEVVAAYDVATGREIWAHGWDASFQESMGGDGPRACPTWHDGKVYALGAEGEFRCLDAATGKRIWSRNILKDNGVENLQWGMSAAPLVVDGKVIVLPGGPAGKSVVAYDAQSGEPVWKTLDDKAAYTSPILVTLAGKRQLVVVTQRRMVGLTVENGSLLWEYPWTTQYDVNVAQPLVTGENRVFISAAYDHGSALVELTPAGNKMDVRQVWTSNRMKNKFSSSVLQDGYIYGLDESILACVQASTGELKWKGGRYGYGQVLLASGQLIVTTETGDVAVVKATPEGHQELARFPAVSGKTWNVPVLAGGYLLVRNSDEMACFRVGTR
jgi:outer membrane protein assembly factor BamB